MNWFVQDWLILGIAAPRFVWVAAFAVLAGTAGAALRLFACVRREARIHRSTTEELDDLLRKYAMGPGEGLSAAAYEILRKTFETKPTLGGAWNNFKKQIILQRNNHNEDCYWSDGSAEVAFSDAAVLASRINRSFFTAVPGLVTGIGLLITFLAILFALAGLRMKGEQIEGMPRLLEGLSGKFVSSVAALFAASIFLPMERVLLHRVERSRQALVNALDDLMPRLTSARILARLQDDISEQSTAFRAFNADLSLKLRQSFSESMGPTLQRMVATLDELNQLLRAAEAQKQDALVNSLADMLRDIQSGMDETLRTMGERFTESISAGAGQQFEQVLASLGTTASLLSNMNTQFEATQAALGTLIAQARDSTAEQLTLGKGQVVELSTVLRQLMSQLKETTGTSVTEMRGVLGTALEQLSSKVGILTEQMSATIRDTTERNSDLVNGLVSRVQEDAGVSMVNMSAAFRHIAEQLSGKVNTLSEQMAATLKTNTEETNSSVKTLIQQADNWSTQSAQQLAALLERYQTHLGGVESLGDQLHMILGQFRDALPQYAAVTKELHEVVVQTRAAAQGASDAATAIRESAGILRNVQDHVSAVATASAEQVARLSETSRQIQDGMRQYEPIFARVNKEAGTLLAQVAEQLRVYTATTRDGYQSMSLAANDLFEGATRRLGGSIEELNESLEDLQEMFERLKARPTDGKSK
jgi:hypothetical protein